MVARATNVDDGGPPRGSGGRPPVAVARDAIKRFLDDHMLDHAAALTYYALMSLFPAALVGISLLGLLGQESTVDHVANYLTDRGAPASTVDAVRSSLRSAVHSHAGASTLLLIVGLAVAAYSASGAMGAAQRALNVVHHVEEERGLVRRKANQVGSTLLLIAATVAVLITVFLGGEVAREVFDVIGLGRTAGAVWTWVRWPLALVLAMAIYSYVYAVAPDHRPPFRLISPGAVVAVLLWIAGSIAFFLYVDNFSAYSATYGAFAGAVILLLWLYLTNVALLLGAEVNAALERRVKARAEDRAASSRAPTSTARGAPGTRGTATGVASR